MTKPSEADLKAADTYASAAKGTDNGVMFLALQSAYLAGLLAERAKTTGAAPPGTNDERDAFYITEHYDDVLGVWRPLHAFRSLDKAHQFGGRVSKVVPASEVERLKEQKEICEQQNTLLIQGIGEGIAEAVKAERERCAKIVIRSTEIPPEALRNGTGVRDRIVIEGERIADLILNPSAEGKSG